MMQAAELAVLDWLQAHLRCDFLDAVMPWISRICDHGEIWILLAAVLLLLRKHRWTGMSLSFALILDLICCNIVLKPLVGRIRPFLVNTAVELLTAPPADASFPSGHTAASFAAVRIASFLSSQRSSTWGNSSFAPRSSFILGGIRSCTVPSVARMWAGEPGWKSYSSRST